MFFVSDLFLEIQAFFIYLLQTFKGRNPLKCYMLAYDWLI